MATLAELQTKLTKYETDYAAIRDRLEDRVTTDQQGYKIGTRELDRLPIPDLQRMAQNLYTNIKLLRSQVARLDESDTESSVFGVIKAS